MIWASIANIGMNIFKKLNFKVVIALGLLVIMGYFGYKYSDNLEKLMESKQSNASLEYSLSQKLETIEQKQRLISNLQSDVFTLQEIQKRKEQQIKKINNENTNFKKELSKVEDKCLDNDMPDDLIRLLNFNED